VIIIAGKAVAKYFYRFLLSSFSNSLDVAASKLNSLTGDEFLGVASVRGAGYVEGADPQPFFDQMDELLQGTDEEKQTAFNLLKAARDKV